MIHRNNPEHITSQEIVANAEKINKIQYLPPQLLSLTKQHNYYGKIVFKIDWLKEKR